MNDSPVYQGPLLQVYRWDEPLTDGTSAVFERCVRPDTVAVLAFIDSETVLLVKEHQLGRTDTFTDLPGGRIDPGETAEVAAARELEEETGYHAERLLLWDEERWGGLISFRSSLFVATNLTITETTKRHLDPTEKIEVEKMPFAELAAYCLKQNLRRTQATLAIIRLAHDPEARQRLETFLKKT